MKTLPTALLRPSILTFVIVLSRKSVLVTASCVLLLQPDLLTAGIGQTQEFTHAGPAGRFGATGELSGDGFNGGDGVQHETDRVWERWGDQAQPSPTKDFPLFKGSVEYVRTNSLRDRELCWRAVADTNHGATMPLRPLVPEVLLPDGTPFLTWEQPASHRRTFFVDVSHADASDENPGSEDKPWKTISQAAAVLEPGDRVLVEKGVYREWVRPARGGTGPDAMIAYEADGDGVVIRGSEPVVGEWQPSVFDGKAVPGVWMIELPERGSVFVVFPQKPTTTEPPPVFTGNPLPITGPWTVTFEENLGAPKSITLDKLASLSEHPDPGVKYFSGIATYHQVFKLAESQISNLKSEILLDLGEVHDIARVSVNGKEAGTAWIAPYRVSIPADLVRTGENELIIEVANPWFNRLIGDEQLPEDVPFEEMRGGRIMTAVPEWVTAGGRSPNGRLLFSSFLPGNIKKDAKLLPSGLLGPVTLEAISKTVGQKDKP